MTKHRKAQAEVEAARHPVYSVQKDPFENTRPYHTGAYQKRNIPLHIMHIYSLLGSFGRRDFVTSGRPTYHYHKIKSPPWEFGVCQD